MRCCFKFTLGGWPVALRCCVKFTLMGGWPVALKCCYAKFTLMGGWPVALATRKLKAISSQLTWLSTHSLKINNLLKRFLRGSFLSSCHVAVTRGCVRLPVSTGSKFADLISPNEMKWGSCCYRTSWLVVHTSAKTKKDIRWCSVAEPEPKNK